MREKWHSGEECMVSMSQNTFQVMQMLAWERIMEDLQLTVSSACAMHNMPVYELTVLKNVLIHHMFMSCMNRTTKFVLDFKHHVQVTGDGHECFCSGGCSQDTTFHVSVSVNNHNSIIWSTELACLVNLKCQVQKYGGETLQGVTATYFILFLCWEDIVRGTIPGLASPVYRVTAGTGRHEYGHFSA
jgi:hypothetical protein